MSGQQVLRELRALADRAAREPRRRDAGAGTPSTSTGRLARISVDPCGRIDRGPTSSSRSAPPRGARNGRGRARARAQRQVPRRRRRRRRPRSLPWSRSLSPPPPRAASPRSRCPVLVGAYEGPYPRGAPRRRPHRRVAPGLPGGLGVRVLPEFAPAADVDGLCGVRHAHVPKQYARRRNCEGTDSRRHRRGRPPRRRLLGRRPWPSNRGSGSGRTRCTMAK